MKYLCCLLTTLMLGTACAQGAGVQTRISFSVMVSGTCELQGRTEASVTLRCTRNFLPADPHSLPALYGQLPPRSLTLVASSPAPSGGTLNEYRVTGGDGRTFY